MSKNAKINQKIIKTAICDYETATFDHQTFIFLRFTASRMPWIHLKIVADDSGGFNLILAYSIPPHGRTDGFKDDKDGRYLENFPSKGFRPKSLRFNFTYEK